MSTGPAQRKKAHKNVPANSLFCKVKAYSIRAKPQIIPAFHGYQLIAVVGKFTKNADIQAWDEAAFYKTNAKQIWVKCTESLFLIMGLQAVCEGGDDSSNHECFVKIYTATDWEYNFHNKTSSVIIARRTQGLNRQAIQQVLKQSLVYGFKTPLICAWKGGSNTD